MKYKFSAQPNPAKKTNNLDTIGGAYYITGLYQEAPSVSNAEYYAKIVKENCGTGLFNFLQNCRTQNMLLFVYYTISRFSYIFTKYFCGLQHSKQIH